MLHEYIHLVQCARLDSVLADNLPAGLPVCRQEVKDKENARGDAALVGGRSRPSASSRLKVGISTV